jgi:hypothetical protein
MHGIEGPLLGGGTARAGGELLVPGQIQGIWRHRDQIAGRARHDYVGAQQVTQRRYGDLNLALRGSRRLDGPQCVDQAVNGDYVMKFKKQLRERNFLPCSP